MTASTPRSSRTSARTRGCCSSATLGEKDAPVARPPQSRRAGPTRRSSRHFRRKSPAHRPCGAVATLLVPRLSRDPRRTAVRGIADVLLGASVARPPHTGCAGAWRRPPLCVRRETPAQALCGADATFFSVRPSRNPRTPAVRGRCDTPPHRTPRPYCANLFESV